MNESAIHPAVISGYGLIEAPFDRSLAMFGMHKRAAESTVSVVDRDVTVSDALAYLDVRTFPASRLALLDLGQWTGVLTNHRTGSDFNDHQYWAGRSVGARTIRVVDSEARWRRDGSRRARLSWEMRSFEFHAPDNEPIRVITSANDGGRWTFFTIGDPLPVETDAPYDAPNPRDRFTRHQLRELLVALGPGPLTADRFNETRRFALLRERHTNTKWQARIDAAGCTLAQADAAAQ